MSIYQEEKPFKPTYLYIKQHAITGLLYFGKTVLSHAKMLKYTGSGKYWNKHLKIHGKKHIVTLWYCLFYTEGSITEFALMCSEQWDVVNARNEFGNKIWANLIPENAMYGGRVKGCIFSEEHRHKISQANRDTVMAKDENNNIVKVSKEIFDNSSNLIGIRRGIVSVEDSNGHKFNISNEDYNNNKNEYKLLNGASNDSAIYRDVLGNCIRVNLFDPRVLSGELVGVRTGAKQSNATRDKIGKSCTGRVLGPQSIEHRKNGSIARKGKVQSFNIITKEFKIVSKETFDAEYLTTYVGIRSKEAIAYKKLVGITRARLMQ